jgi:hypothetical protein
MMRAHQDKWRMPHQRSKSSNLTCQLYCSNLGPTRRSQNCYNSHNAYRNRCRAGDNDVHKQRIRVHLPRRRISCKHKQLPTFVRNKATQGYAQLQGHLSKCYKCTVIVKFTSIEASRTKAICGSFSVLTTSSYRFQNTLRRFRGSLLLAEIMCP